jgi:hypothetical protein
MPSLLLLLAVLLTACGTSTSPVVETQYIVVTSTILPTSTITNTPDPCAPENLQAEVQKVHKYMRQFDDASTLAASSPRDGLANSIAGLQQIRRDAEDQPIPSCLATLKTYQISHMNSVINTLVSFMGGADKATVDRGIALSREQHDKYTLELARLLGVTVEPAVTVTPEQTLSP